LCFQVQAAKVCETFSLAAGGDFVVATFLKTTLEQDRVLLKNAIRQE
jgi:hypothetical protein